jgi:hypothetical protein
MTPNKVIDTMAEDAKKKNGRYRKWYRETDFQDNQEILTSKIL